MLLRVLPIVLAAAVFTAATCVTSFEAQDPSGPWTGEFTNYEGYDISNFEWQAKVVDANGAGVPQITMNICPHSIPAGGTGAFEMIASGGTGPYTAQPPSIQGYGSLSLSKTQPDLDVSVKPGTAGHATLTIQNDSDGLIFSGIGYCAVARKVDGSVMAVAQLEDLPGHVMPGESADVELSFTQNVGSASLITPHVTGIPVTLQKENSDRSLVIDTGPFDVTLPEGWSYVPRQGIDSFVGEFNRGATQIIFDYGWYSGGLGQYEDDPAYDVSHETIDGRDAVVVTPVGSGSGVTAAHIIVGDDADYGVMRTTILLYGEDVPPALRAEALSIFRSLKFEEGWE